MVLSRKNKLDMQKLVCQLLLGEHAKATTVQPNGLPFFQISGSHFKNLSESGRLSKFLLALK